MERIAVIGGGAAGLGAAWALSRRYDTTLYEAADHLGGHARTVDIEIDGRSVPLDTGFMVYNEVTYPLLTRLFNVLGVATQPSSMSFSVSVDDGGFEYAGSLRGLLANPKSLANPRLWRMMWDVCRFNRDAKELVRQDTGANRHTLSQFIRQQRYSRQFADRYLLPMGAAIWSASFDEIGAYPASQFARFFDNHGLLQFRNRPQWRTVIGGSREYIRRLCSSMRTRVFLERPVLAVRRLPTEVRILERGGTMESYDHIVLATHANTSLRLLGDQATEEERRMLGKVRYSRNRGVLHMDARLMPKRRRVWSSWNYMNVAAENAPESVSVTYWLNRLQGLSVSRPLLMSLNPVREPLAPLVLGEFEYEHPILDRAAMTAQHDLETIQGTSRTWFCGAYLGFGFHEDALRSGLDVAAALHAPAPWRRAEADQKPVGDAATAFLPEAAE